MSSSSLKLISRTRWFPPGFTWPFSVKVALGISALLMAGFVGLGWLWWRSPSRRDLSKAIEQGRAYLRHGRPDLAFLAVSDARDEEPGSGEAVALAAQALIRFGELRGARLALERALRLNPDQFEAAVTLAELHVDLGNGHRGAEVFESAARLRPREFRVWLALAKVLQDLFELPRAIEAYETVLELRPNHREALIGVIRCWLLSHEPSRAVPWITKALQRYPNDPTILGLAAREAYDQERFDEAIARADRALTLDSQNVDALLARARARIARSQWEEALPDAEHAAAAWPSDLETLQLLLKVETRLGLTAWAAATLAQSNRARERVERMNQLSREVALHPEDPQLPWKMGQTALEGGSTVLATRCFEAALALDPNYQPARASLAALRALQPRHPQQPGAPGRGAFSSSPLLRPSTSGASPWARSREDEP